MDLENVQVFVRVVQAKSFTEAGKQLGLPKSTISRRVSRLEDDLGVRLLQRTTRKLALTEAGSAFFEQVAPALEAVRSATAWVGEMQSIPRGTIRVTAPFDFGTHFLSRIAAEFSAEYPEIRVEVSLSERMVDLISEGFDLAFRGGRLEDSSLVARPLGKGKAWVIASPDYLAARGIPKHPRDLAGHECILFRASFGADRWTLEGPDGATETVSVRGRVTSDEFGFVKSMVAGGHGIGCVPWMLCEPDLSSGRLVRILSPWGVPGGQMHLVYPSAEHLPQRVVLFRDFVLDWIRRPPWSSLNDSA